MLVTIVTACGGNSVPAVHVPAWAHVAPEQIAEARKLSAPVAFENELGMRFVLIPAGTFMMGDPKAAPRLVSTIADDVSLSRHQVTISRPYYLQITEVSSRQYTMLQGPRAASAVDLVESEDLEKPIAGLTFAAVQSACQRLSALLGRPYRLPTEAEWERACRCGTDMPFAYGESINEGQGRLRFSDSPSARENGHPLLYGDEGTGLLLKGSLRVGSLAPSPWGLYDMHGNVREWCRDWARAYPMHAVVDPDPGPSDLANYRSVRGGAYSDRPEDATSFMRDMAHPDTCDPALGFRLVTPLLP